MAGAVTLLVLAAGGTAWGLSRSSGTSYRTAVAARDTVTQTLSATGTVSPVSRASESFQVAGTVARVEVKTGQRVQAGQILGHLERSELRAQLRSAQSTLAAARSRMSADESGESDATSKGSSPALLAARPTPVGTSRPGGSSGNTGSAGSGGLGREQAAVRAAQQATDQALAEASSALKAVDVACSPQPTGTSTPDPDPSASSDPAEPAPSDDACTTAGATLLADQQAVDRAERQLDEAESVLTKTLTGMLASARSSSSSPGSSGTHPSSSRDGATASAAEIALDQASIDQARAAVAADRADLDQATLRATIAGRIAAVTVTRGDQVSASASEPAVIIVGSRQEQVTIDLSATQIRAVKIGMTAHIRVDGSARTLSGHVVAIDSAGTVSSSGTITYPVTITLPAGTSVVGGAAAAVSLVIASIDDVLAVPTSAVHYAGTARYVELLRNGKEARHSVKVGAIGGAVTQILSGLEAGQLVVLADLDAAVPSSSSTLTRGGGFFGRGGGGTFARRFVRGGGAGGAVQIPSGSSLG